MGRLKTLSEKMLRKRVVQKRQAMVDVIMM